MPTITEALVQLSSVFQLAMGWLWNLANSNFMAALAGAFAGAHAAQRIADRSLAKQRELEEIRNTNAAIEIAYGIAASYCLQKYQHVRRLKETFQKQQADLHEFQGRKREGLIPADKAFEFEADFETLSPIEPPLETLRTLMFEKISLVGRSFRLLTALSESVDQLTKALAIRNEFIAACRATPPETSRKLAQVYFGLRDEHGRIDHTYPSSVEAIASMTDNNIFFGKLLVECLVAHGQQLAETYGRDPPSISNPSFAKAAALGLIPDASGYPGWEQQL